jgi:hypothetical protein
MPETGLRLEISDGVAHLTFTEAARGNPIDGPLCASLSETAIQVSENRGIRCVLLAAEGKAFSYGGDVGAFVTDLDNLAHNIKRWTTTLHSAIASSPVISGTPATASSTHCPTSICYTSVLLCNASTTASPSRSFASSSRWPCSQPLRPNDPH